MMNKKLLSSLFLLTAYSYSTLHGQDDNQGGGGESAAESSVSSSSSEKKNAAPESLESNPVVTVVKAGIPFETAKAVQVSTILKIAQAGGTITNLKSSASVVAAGEASLDNIVSAIDAGISFSSNGGAGFLDVAKKVKSGSISTSDLAAVKSNLDNGVDLDAQIEFGIADTKTAIQAGYSAADILEVSKLTGDAKAARQNTIKTVSAEVVAGQESGEIVDKDTLESIVAASGGSEITQEQKDIAKYAATVKALTTNSSLLSSITSVLSDASYTGADLQSALTEAVKVADLILRPVDISKTTDLNNEINLKSFSGSGYNTELIKLLVKYGAIADVKYTDIDNNEYSNVSTDRSSLAIAAINGFSSSSTSSQALEGLLGSTTGEYANLLSALTGDPSIGDPDGDGSDFLNPKTNSVINIPLQNISLRTGSDITITGGEDEINFSSKLGKASSNHSASVNGSDRKVYIIGAAKDLTIKNDVTLKNSNQVEDHALVIGAADDLYLRAKYSPENSASYSDPKPINITYEGSNLGLGAQSTIRLINANITTGGNLAIGSLDELHIKTTSGRDTSETSTFTVGQHSDADNVYLYASNLIAINGLAFAGNVDDVYMDAITIDLANVTFPENSEVMARSRDGTINNGIGSVKFGANVYHGSDILTGATGSATNEFNGKDGEWDLNKKIHNGKSAFVIRKR